MDITIDVDKSGGGSGQSGSSGGSSGGSGGGSSGGGGGSSAPPVDPIIAQRVSMFQGIYERLWGEPATKAYLEGFAHKGFNTHEFEMIERTKPAFRKTKTYRNEADHYASMLQSWGIT